MVIREYQNNAMKKGFRYNAEKGHFVCVQGENLEFQKLIYKRVTQKYYRLGPMLIIPLFTEITRK